MARFAVVGCSRCDRVWTVETRHATTSCAACGRIRTTRKLRAFWAGDDATYAAAAAGAIQAALGQGMAWSKATEAVAKITPTRHANHDSPADAAAAKARSVVNPGGRAEAAMLWLTRLVGPASEALVLTTLDKAGLDPDRAAKEIVRMLACDVIYEPTVGHYALLSP